MKDESYQATLPRRTHLPVPCRARAPAAQDQHDAHDQREDADEQEDEADAEVGGEEDVEARENRQEADEAEQQAALADLHEEADSLKQQPGGDDVEQQAVVCSREDQAEDAGDDADNAFQEEDRSSPELRAFAAEDGAAQRSQAIDDRVDAEDIQKEE